MQRHREALHRGEGVRVRPGAQQPQGVRAGHRVNILPVRLSLDMSNSEQNLRVQRGRSVPGAWGSFLEGDMGVEWGDGGWTRSGGDQSEVAEPVWPLRLRHAQVRLHVSLLTGVPVDQLAEYGGTPEEGRE